MNSKESPETFRTPIVEALRIAASAELQERTWKDTGVTDIVTEIFGVWDDAYDPEDPDFLEAFSEAEREALDHYDETSVLIVRGIPYVTLEQFQARPQWERLAELARSTIEALGIDPQAA